MSRTRSEGWKHGKIEGHANEARTLDRLGAEAPLRKLVFAALFSGERVPSDEYLTITDIGKLRVDTLLGDRQFPKPDLLLERTESQTAAISVKMSLSGQAWLVTLDRFFLIFENLAPESLTPEVREAFHLFIGGSKNVIPVREKFNRAIGATPSTDLKIRMQEIRQQRLSATTMSACFPELADALVQFFRDNIEIVTQLTFSRGATKDSHYWANVILYTIEGVGDFAFNASTIAAKAKLHRSEIVFGDKNGGTTIQLPTGFLQMHKGELQFHHKLGSIRAIM